MEANVDNMIIKSLKYVSDVCSTISTSSRNEPDYADDSHMLFCKSLVTSLKNLEPVKNRQARMKIQQVLFELEFGSELVQ